MVKQKLDKFSEIVVMSSDTITYIYNQVFWKSRTMYPFPLTPFLNSITLALMVLAVIFVLCAVLRSLQKATKVLCVSNVPKQLPKLPSLPIIGILYHIFRSRNDLPNLFTKWAIDHKPAGRVKICGHDFVLLHDPSLIQKILMSGDLGHVKKPEIIYGIVFTKELKDGLVSSEPHIWKGHRNIVSKAFTYEALKSYFPIINHHAHKFIDELKEQSTEKTFSLIDLIHKKVFSVVSHIVTGTDIMSDNHKECSTFYRSFHRCQEIVSGRLMHPWLLSNIIWKFHPLQKEMNDCIYNIDSCIRTLLRRRREQMIASSNNNEKSVKSLMDVMMSSEMSDQEILTEMTSFLIAGHDTVSVSLNFLMINLAMNPQHQRACREEVDEIFDILAKNEGNTFSDITLESLSELKYLDRCIKESLRLYPTIPILCRELEKPLKLDDNMELKAGVNVVVSPWTIQRNPEYYPNPDKFDPDRFLPENCKNKSIYTYIPFSAGKRNCVGWKLAMYEIQILAAYILRNFEVHTSHKEQDIKVQFNIALALQEKINLELKRR